jgi:heme-degrading monooxygenase HmoA
MKYWIDNKVPAPPYLAVIFISKKTNHLEGYKEMDELTMELAIKQPGFLGYESCNHDNEGIFISYWKDYESIENWRHHTTHQAAKNMGKKDWYERYVSQIAEVKHSVEFIKNQ